MKGLKQCIKFPQQNINWSGTRISDKKLSVELYVRKLFFFANSHIQNKYGDLQALRLSQYFAMICSFTEILINK